MLDLPVDAAPTRSSDQHKAMCDWPLRKALVVLQKGFGAGEALRFKFFFRFLSTTPIIYAYGLFSCWTYCWTFRSTLNLARLPLKTRSATMEIREGLVVTPLSATRRFPPTRWHPRRAGTGRAPKASRCWRRHSNSASVCTRIFRATKTL